MSVLAENQTEPMVLVDQAARDAFIGEIDTNFSVIAPAGVGKTTAITRRVAEIAREHPEWLSRLTIVTYTQKAAMEMEERVRAEVLKNGPSHEVLKHLGRAFFGTIHSFCLNLLKRHGHELGLVGDLEIMSDDRELWDEFIRGEDGLTELADGEIVKELKKYTNLSKILWLTRKLESSEARDCGKLPWVDLGDVLGFPEEGRSGASIIKNKEEIGRWYEALGGDEEVIGVPEIRKGGKAFLECWNIAIEPLWLWSGRAAIHVASKIRDAYEAFRLKRGVVTYDDLIMFAGRLVDNKDILAQLQAEEYRVILDEAQDTDKDQFKLLLSIASKGSDLGHGRFCMVGDPQQSIYSSRADLPSYIKTHEGLVERGVAKAVEFNVTMRCSEAVVKHANAVYPDVMSRGGEVDYVTLQAKPGAERGDVVRHVIPRPAEEIKGAEALAEYEVNALVEWIDTKGAEGLGVNDWSDMAILCPRKSWLMPIWEALTNAGISAQVHSSDTTAGDDTAYAWFTALLTIMVEPWNAFEVMGVLREIYTISDHDIAEYSQKHKSEGRLHPMALGNGVLRDGVVGEQLAMLEGLLAEISEMGIGKAVQHIVQTTELRERIGTIEGQDGVDALELLMAKAMQAEEAGERLKTFVEELQEGYGQSVEGEGKLSGHVQLLTAHKSKGLEWDVVLVPFMHRPIRYPVQEYPQVYKTGGESPIQVALFNHTAKAQWVAAQSALRESELRRLLYVTTTRAKRMLVYIDDEEVYGFQDKHSSFANLMGVAPGGSGRGHWKELNETVTLKPKAFEADNLNKACVTVPELLSYKERVRRRILPSSLVEHEENWSGIAGGAEYGDWWHGVMEHMEWGSEFETEELIGGCNEPGRGRTELELLRGSDVLPEVAGMTCSTEVPFLDCSGKDIIEGIIDFVGVDPEAQRIVIIDWKTDGVSEGKKLVELYQKQVFIYGEVMARQYPKFSVSTYIYSTVLGKLIPLN